MGSRINTIARTTWAQICHQHAGRWVALDNVRYEPVTSQPMEADVVDTDDDLAELCGRMRALDRTSCAILFCEDEAPVTPPLRWRTGSPPSRASQP